jgi:hypothetical protein
MTRLHGEIYIGVVGDLQAPMYFCNFKKFMFRLMLLIKHALYAPDYKLL